MKRLMMPLVYLTFLFIAYNVDGQNKTLKIFTGYSIGKVDKRYDFLYDEYPTAIANTVIRHLDDNSPDDEYFIGIGYFKIFKNKLSIGIELDYSRMIQDFFIPVNVYNLGERFDVFVWREKSYYHLIQTVPEIKFNVLDKKIKLGLSFSGIGNVSFLKHIEPYNLKASRIEYFSTELYPGIFMGYKRFNLNVGVRAWHWKYRDDAIANNGLKVDPYNPFKMRLSLSYDIYKW
ncbi:MAG: hypothetical protein J5I59_00120 [Saprospiraceae bacterium]|nr:hypothetical protein [Saprospiraceae bacterium]